MSELHVGLAAMGGLVLATGLLSRPLKSSWCSSPLLALGVGVLLGPEALGLLDIRRWGDPEKILEESARLTLAIGLMGVALRLPPGYFKQRLRSMAVLLGLGMPLMWLSAAVLAHWLLELPFLVALLLGAVVAPTDPIVATSIVTGRVAEENLPEGLRHTISAESGANDGLAYPLVLLPVLLLTRSPADAWLHWLTRILLWEVGGAVAVGGLIGLAAGRLLGLAESRRSMDAQSFLSFTLALSLLALGAAKLSGTDGVLAVFVAGVTFDRVVSKRDRVEEERVQEAVNLFFTLPIFGLLGLALPWAAWSALGWRGLALAAGVLVLRRLPVLLLLGRFVPQLKRFRDVVFAGWFGPVGVAALFYAMLALRRTGEEIAWSAASLVICASLVAHGVTGAPFARIYGRRGTSTSDAAHPGG